MPKKRPTKRAAKKEPESPGEEKLSEREFRFVEAFVECGIGRESVRRAGYSKVDTGAQFVRLMERPRIQFAIAELRAEVCRRTKLTPEEVTNNLRREAQLAIQAKDRIKASELLGQTLAMFVERHEVTDALTDEQRRARLLALIAKGKEAPAPVQVSPP